MPSAFRHAISADIPASRDGTQRLGFATPAPVAPPMPPAPASRSLFGDTVQPESLSLFSSTSSDPLALWTLHRDTELAEDSGVQILADATDAAAPSDLEEATSGFKLRVEAASRGTSIETVLHIQSPAIRNTFVRSPPSLEAELGIKLPHISFQFRSIGNARPFAFEVGIKDRIGCSGIVRLSSFQTKPKLYLPLASSATAGPSEPMKSRPSRPLLHLPLTTAPTPDQDEATLTAWQVVTLPLDRIARSLSDTSLLSATPQDSRPSHLDPFGEFDSISYVKIHANVRLRRIWCSNSLPDHDLAEFQVFT